MIWLYVKALVLGVVEGLTEFIPVSSTGHLIIAEAFLTYPEGQRVTFVIFIQLGAILAVVWHYRRELLAMIRRANGDAPARHLMMKILLAFVPAAVAGLLLHSAIDTYLFKVPTVAAALIVGGIAILAIERLPHRIAVEDIEQTRWRDAWLIGLAQVAALFPGISRAGATIMGGLLAGLSRPVAAQFSFFLALPTITAASLFSLVKASPTLSSEVAIPLALGFFSAFFSALVVIRLFISYVQRHDFCAFGYYRIIAGLALFLLYESW